MGTGGSWVGPWLHGGPEPECGNGKRVLIRRLCFGPAESWVWYGLDGAFFREVRVLEGAQSGEAGVEAVGREEIRRLLEEEALLCEGRGGSDIAERLRAEAEKIR